MTYFNDVLKNKDRIDMHQALSENVATLERIAKYLDEMLDENPSTVISNDERDLFGDYRLMVLA